MEDSTRRKLFRPSAAPGKEKCGHFEPTISTSPNAARGTDIHAEICEKVPRLWRELLKAIKGPEDVEPALSFINPPYIRYAVRIMYESGLRNISAPEQVVELHDAKGDFVTEGICDLYGINEPLELMVYDWKTGQERDYSAQVVLYGLCRMQEDNFKKAWLYEVFVDQERTYRTEITRELAEERIFKIVESVRNPREHTMNKHCDWCDLQHDCPAWLWERKKLGGYLPQKERSEISFEERLELVKSNPVLLGHFMTTWKRMEKYVKKAGITEYALDQMKKGQKLNGLKLALSSRGTQYITLE